MPRRARRSRSSPRRVRAERVSVVLDIQGIQSPAHGERGVARYLLELALALDRWHPGRISRFVLNPDLAVPGTAEPLVAGGRLTFSDRLDSSDGRLYHIGSAFEYIPFDRIWPQAVHEGRMRLVVTLYDLIPKLFPDVYLSQPATRSWYTTRLELLRRADRLLAISEATAADAVRELGVPADRVIAVGAAVSERFRRPTSREDAFATVRSALPWIEPGYVFYVGGIEPRKNIDRLLDAYARLPDDLRGLHQLIVVCRVLPAERARLERRLRRLGVAGRVRFPGYLPDELLVSLYQAAELFVFPSLYEGFGLPIAEAQACGAPVIASRSSSLLELVRDEEALFDPSDTHSIATTLERALRDVSLRTRLGEQELDERHTWRGVADRTAAAYDEVLALPRRPRRRRPQIALVTPLPPQRSGVADYSYRLLAQLGSHCAVDAYVDVAPDEVRAPEGVVVLPLRQLEPMERVRGRYDAVVYCLGNSEFHADALAFLRRRPGIVLAHDVRLSGLYSWIAANRPELEPRGFAGALRSMYGHRLPPEVGASGWLSYEDANRYGVYMAQEAIALSQRFLVHSEYAAQVARLDALPDDEKKVEVLGFACPDPEEFPREEPPEPIIATFGLVAPVKQTEKVIEAFAHLADAHPTATLAVVGPAGAAGALEACRRLVARLGLRDRTDVTGEVDDERFRSWIGRAALAVQLRQTSNGESAASVADCFAAGTPTVVSAFGSSRELPDDCVVKVEREIGAVSLARVLDALLKDGSRRAALGRTGRAYARSHSFAHVAAHLVDVLARTSPAWPNGHQHGARRLAQELAAER
jgi:glycosyltransferase involved in cell wall biosynthesis